MTTENYDLVVFGGTPSGVAAAVTMGKRGRSVALVCAGSTVGGIISNGLGASDIGGANAVTGFALDFFTRVRTLYANPTTWRVIPSDAETIFAAMLAEANVSVFKGETLQSVGTSGRLVTSITTDRVQYNAKTFIDASYTVDLASMAGAPYRLGYEDWFYYGQPYNGKEWEVQSTLPTSHLAGAEQAFQDNPFVDVTAPGPTWSGESAGGMPTMTHRLCLTKVAANRVAFAKTPNYELYANSWRRWLAGMPISVAINSNGTISAETFQIAQLHNGKWDMNSGHGTFMDVPIPMELFTGSPTDRQAIIDLHEDYQRNWLWFLQNDSGCPQAVRDAFADFGLCADEFTDNNNWPREPYVREARRIVGRNVLTTHNIYDPAKRVCDDSIAIGTYLVDNRASYVRYDAGKVWRDMSDALTSPWYEIPRGVIHPINIDNLMVTCGISASSRAYGSVRMEPQYMALGEAAGAIAYTAYQRNEDAVATPYSSVKYILTQQIPSGYPVAKIKLSAVGASVPVGNRAGIGLDPSTLEPIAYTPTVL
jgi:hypothetical protein